MGCTVDQSEMSTTVTGPPRGSLRAIEVDMSEVTDTFMTAAAVMVRVILFCSVLYPLEQGCSHDHQVMSGHIIVGNGSYHLE